jgi:hypothetical protein
MKKLFALFSLIGLTSILAGCCGACHHGHHGCGSHHEVVHHTTSGTATIVE